MSDTKIEWCDKVYNPITGCTPVGAGCDHCYARRMAERFGRSGAMRDGEGVHAKSFQHVLFHPDRLYQPLRWRQKKCECGGALWKECPRCHGEEVRPLRIFVNSMGDIFHPDVPGEWIGMVHEVIYRQPNHTFIVLTKRPDRAKDYYTRMYKPWNWMTPMNNLHLGVSVWDQESADRFIPILLDTPAAVRVVSIEPMLGPVRIHHYAYPHPKNCTCFNCPRAQERKLHHVILGGETGPGARPINPDWVRLVRDQCQAAGVPFFFKQWGSSTRDNGTATGITGNGNGGNILDGRTWEELP